MTEKKICTFSRAGYRLQLLKITDNASTPYYQVRQNRRIVATFTTLEAANRKFMGLTYEDTMQKKIEFGGADAAEPIQAPEIDTLKNLAKLEAYQCADGYRLFGRIKNLQDLLIITKILDMHEKSNNYYKNY